MSSPTTEDLTPHGEADRRPDGIATGRRVPVVVLVIVLAVVASIWQLTRGGDDPAVPGASNSQTDAGDVTEDTTRDPFVPVVIPPKLGATLLEGGVPTGYEQSEDGAVAAATDYVALLLGSPRMFDPAQRVDIITRAVAPNDQRRISEELGQLYASLAAEIGLGPNGEYAGEGRVILRIAPWGYHVDSFTDTDATISIWYETLGGVTGLNADNPVHSGYATAAVYLQWNGDWDWSSATIQEGPAPLGVTDGGAAADITGMQRIMDEFTPYSYGTVAR